MFYSIFCLLNKLTNTNQLLSSYEYPLLQSCYLYTPFGISDRLSYPSCNIFLSATPFVKRRKRFSVSIRATSSNNNIILRFTRCANLNTIIKMLRTELYTLTLSKS